MRKIVNIDSLIRLIRRYSLAVKNYKRENVQNMNNISTKYDNIKTPISKIQRNRNKKYKRV